MNKTVIISTELQAVLVEYLKDKPYNEVAAMIQGLATAQPTAPPDGDNDVPKAKIIE